jgi:hypothetical protein
MAKKDFILPGPLAKVQTSSSVGFQVSRTGLQALKGQLYQVEDQPFDEPIGTSPLGTPVYDDVSFPAGQYVNLFGDIIAFEEVRLQNVLIVANRAKRVIKTPVQGRDGTIKEYISAGDYIITVSGQLNSESNTFPELELQNLNAIMDANAALSVVSSFLNDGLNVGHIVIESDSYKQVRGSRNSIDISFQAVSDVSIDLEELIIE